MSRRSLLQLFFIFCSLALVDCRCGGALRAVGGDSSSPGASDPGGEGGDDAAGDDGGDSPAPDGPSFAPSILLNGPVNAMVKDASGDVYLAGPFTSVTNGAAPKMVRLSSAGVHRTTFNAALKGGFNAKVGATAQLPDGSIIAIGDFTRYRGLIANYIAKINTSGDLDTVFNPQSGANGFSGSPDALLVIGTDIFVVGGVALYRGTSVDYLAKITGSTGELDGTFHSVVGGFDVTTKCIATDGAGFIYVGGEFTAYRGSQSTYIAKINASTGALNAAFEANGSPNNPIQSIGIDSSNGYLYAAGRGAPVPVTSYDGNPVTEFFRTSLAGVYDATFDTSASGPNDGVLSISVDSATGDVYLGGEFTIYGVTSRPYVAKVSGANVLDATFDTNAAGPNGNVHTVLYSGGAVYIGGNFSAVGATKASNLAKLNASTAAIDTTFTTATQYGTDDYVYGLSAAVDGSGDIFVSGLMRVYISGTTLSGVVKLDGETGDVDTTFHATSGGVDLTQWNHTVNAVAVDSSYLYIGGNFASYRGSIANNIARVSLTDGSLDTTFNPQVGANGTNNEVYAIAVDGSDVYVGGAFAQYRGSGDGNTLAKVSTAGVMDTTFNAGGHASEGFGSTVRALVVTASGLYVGGQFTTFRGDSANRIAKLSKTNGDLDTTFSPAMSNGFAGGNVFAMTQLDASNIVVGGGFMTYRGVTANRIALLNLTDGSMDSTFSPDPGANGFDGGTPRSLGVIGSSIFTGQGDMYFNEYRGDTIQDIVKISSDGTLASGAFNSSGATIKGMTGTSLQMTFLPFSDSKLLVGGYSEAVSGDGDESYQPYFYMIDSVSGVVGWE